jgi:hypothetical protein
MATTALKKINAEVKRIKRLHPNTSHKAAQKQAGKMYREGKISGTRTRKAGKKKRVSGAGSHRASSGRKVSGLGANTMGQTETQYKKMLTEKLGWLLATQRTTTGARARKAMSPMINELTKKLRALN